MLTQILNWYYSVGEKKMGEGCAGETRHRVMVEIYFAHFTQIWRFYELCANFVLPFNKSSNLKTQTNKQKNKQHSFVNPALTKVFHRQKNTPKVFPKELVVVTCFSHFRYGLFESHWSTVQSDIPRQKILSLGLTSFCFEKPRIQYINVS